MSHHRAARILITSLLTLLLSLGVLAQSDTEPVRLLILNTADEHGWLEPFQAFGDTRIQGGAANVYALWQQEDPAQRLILSGGDNWTGPAISTWFEGTPVVQAMNTMGYAASVIGNHEFDFGLEVMQQRFAEAAFPYLSANIIDTDTGELASFAQPYTLIEVNGVMIGVIGLTTTLTPTTTHPRNLTGLRFGDYAEALARYVPQMRAEGADLVVVLSHVCVGELAQLARQVPDLVDIMFAGHCNESLTRTVEGVHILAGGDAWRSYARLELELDPQTFSIREAEASVVDVVYEEGAPLVEPDATLLAQIAESRAEVDAQLNTVIGYSETGIQRRSWQMANFVTDAWLWAYPNADIAMTNFGGFRAEIPPGEITWGDIVTMLPFDNVLIETRLTGAQIIENILCCRPAVAGLSYSVRGGSLRVLLADGTALDEDTIYTVLVNDFMYLGGDDYLFNQQDPDAYDTGIHWRQPVIDYAEWLGSSTPDNSPLETLLDPLPRG